MSTPFQITDLFCIFTCMCSFCIFVCTLHVPHVYPYPPSLAHFLHYWHCYILKEICDLKPSPLPYQHSFEKEHLALRDTMVGREGCACVWGWVWVWVWVWGGGGGEEEEWRLQFELTLSRLIFASHSMAKHGVVSLSPCLKQTKPRCVVCWCVRTCWLVSCLTHP